ncbi:MAG: hypothetical protein ACRECE_01250, partial [Xanthobacteraceae bacterium]
MAEREEKTDANWTLALLHEFSRYVVNCGDMVRINGVAKAEAVGEESGAEQEGITVEGNNGYEPENDVCDA